VGAISNSKNEEEKDEFESAHDVSSDVVPHFFEGSPSAPRLAIDVDASKRDDRQLFVNLA
jgi:hypothetical protein